MSDLLGPRRLVGPAGFTRALLERGERRAVALPLKRRPAPGGSPRVRWIAEAVKRDAIGWLGRAGGWRRRQVVVRGRRREGRVWDPRIFPALDVRFTPGPLRLLVAAMEAPEGIPRLDAEQRARVREGVAAEAPATGDLLALHRLLARLVPRAVIGRGLDLRCPSCGASMERAPRREGKRKEKVVEGCSLCEAVLSDEQTGREVEAYRRWRRLLPLSPLTLLFRPHLAGAHPDLAAEGELEAALAPLFVGDRAVLLSYLDEALARAWIEEERSRRDLPPAAAQESYAATSRTLQALERVARGRPDALRPVIAFYARYTLRAFGGRAPVTDALRRQAQDLDRASEREAFLRQASDLFALGRGVTEAVERALATPFVDRTEEEKVLLADYHERFRDVGPEVEAIRRELAGEIG